MTITPEMKRAVAEANGSPLHLEDPETGAVYLVTRLEPAEAATDAAATQLGPGMAATQSEPRVEGPEGIVAAWDAFRRDLPAMMADPKLKGKVVLYHRDQRVAVGKRRYELNRLAVERGIPHGEFWAFYVEPEDDYTDFFEK